MISTTLVALLQVIAFTPVQWNYTGTLEHLVYKGQKRLYHVILPEHYHHPSHHKRRWPAIGRAYFMDIHEEWTLMVFAQLCFTEMEPTLPHLRQRPT